MKATVCREEKRNTKLSARESLKKREERKRNRKWRRKKMWRENQSLFIEMKEKREEEKRRRNDSMRESELKAWKPYEEEIFVEKIWLSKKCELSHYLTVIWSWRLWCRSSLELETWEKRSIERREIAQKARRRGKCSQYPSRRERNVWRAMHLYFVSERSYSREERREKPRVSQTEAQRNRKLSENVCEKKSSKKPESSSKLLESWLMWNGMAKPDEEMKLASIEGYQSVMKMKM